MEKHVKILHKIIVLIFLSSVTLFSACHLSETKQLVDHVYVIKKPIRTPTDILPVKGPQVIPYVYTRTISLANLSVDEKKRKFFDMMLPAVLVAKTNLDMNRKEVLILMAKKKISQTEKVFLKRQMKKFKTNNLADLNIRMHTFPVSIVLAQAAIESGWGTSRFFLKGNNPFGIWSFSQKHQRMAADSTRNGTKIFLRRFNDLEQAIDAYYTLLATGQPFIAFREARMVTNQPDSLIQALKMYSERRESYVDDVARVISTSHLRRYDSCEIAPDYIRESGFNTAFSE